MPILKPIHFIFYLLLLVCLSPTFMTTDKGYRPYDELHTESRLDTLLSGEQLANLYCKMCHEFPEPKLLDKETWINSVLPNMGLRMGVKIPGVDPFAGTPKEDLEIVKSLGVYPEAPIISDADWNKIIEYYKKEAPEEPIKINSEAPISNLVHFNVDKVFINNKGFPQTSLLEFNRFNATLYLGEANNLIHVLDDKMQLKSTRRLISPAVDIEFKADGAIKLLTIGKFDPSDQNLGELNSIQRGSSNQNIRLPDLPRPVSFSSGDLNGDDKEDVVICGFGHNRGKLLLYDNFDPGKASILKNEPGSRMVEINDFNNDNKPDLMVLMAQAREQISIFYNKGQHKFEEKVVLRFPPVYGVSYFELVDFNNDGYMDILLTNGDNWDYSVIRKNYHGIRIYLNDGRDNFENTFFYPLYGASKAIARDFDNDGDLDIAASAFYHNDDNPEHSFIYLLNSGSLNFTAYATPEASLGKWLTMDVGDYDRDGDLDIFLGSYFHTFGEYVKQVAKGAADFPNLLVLTNNSITN